MSQLDTGEAGQPFYFFFGLRQLFLKPRLGQQHRFRRLVSCGSLAVGAQVVPVKSVSVVSRIRNDRMVKPL